MALFTASHCPAQTPHDISGKWQGHLSDKGAPLFLTWLKIEKVGTNDWKATFYWNTGARPNRFRGALVPLTLDGSKLSFPVKTMVAEFTGNLSSDDNEIVGRFGRPAGGEGYQFEFHRAFIARPVTVRELEDLIEIMADRPDSQVAGELRHLRLTERLSGAGLDKCEARLHGKEEMSALEVLAKTSAFLDPPAAEILSDKPKPDVADQRRMIARTVEYVTNTTHNLPNFSARRALSSFQQRVWIEDSPRMTGKSNVSLRYEKGEEHLGRTVIGSDESGLETSGEFGPILGTAMLDAAAGSLVWSHWEQGQAGPIAVYRYAISEKQSHYRVEGEPTAYEGKITIDPQTGAVLRLVLRADPGPSSQLMVADITVEYGPVEIGHKTYICPVKSVALSQGLMTLWLNGAVFDQYSSFDEQAGSARN
jgi:hypothetical protein